MMNEMSKRDWIIVGSGAVVLVASFLPWESASDGGFSASDSAWNAGFAAWFGSLLAVAAAAAVLARHMGQLREIRGVGPNLAACGLAVAALVFLGLRLLTLPRGSGLSIYGPSGSYGPSFGAFAGVAFAAVQVVVTVLNVRATGEKIPSFKAAASSSMPAPPRMAPTSPMAQPAQSYQDELTQRLGRLDYLRANGMISDAEYAEQRRRIINQL
jgi:hypothetical protein